MAFASHHFVFLLGMTSPRKRKLQLMDVGRSLKSHDPSINRSENAPILHVQYSQICHTVSTFPSLPYPHASDNSFNDSTDVFLKKYIFY